MAKYDLTSSQYKMLLFLYAQPFGAARFVNGTHYGFFFTLALAVAGFIVSLLLKGKKSAK